jgi:hypothetical protein
VVLDKGLEVPPCLWGTPVPASLSLSPATPVSWIHTRSRGSVCHQEDRLTVALCLLAATSLLLSSVGLAVTVIKCE